MATETGIPAMQYLCDHVHLRSRDAVAAAAFYAETFGAREIKRVGYDPVQRVVIDLGGLTVYIEQATPDANPAVRMPSLGVEHIGLVTDDIEAAVADLTGRGVPLLMGITARGPGLRIAFFEGPDGAAIEILERKDA
jgi:catechol 2,3-dioxygenase-like lactoylglutathione lyase family enzyme